MRDPILRRLLCGPFFFDFLSEARVASLGVLERETLTLQRDQADRMDSILNQALDQGKEGCPQVGCRLYRVKLRHPQTCKV